MCSDKDFSWEDALRFSDEKIFARVNCKKEVGYSTISDRVLKESIDKYFDNLKEQILKIDADIFVCCGHQKDDNLILNTVKDIYKNEFDLRRKSPCDTLVCIYSYNPMNAIIISNY